MTKTNIALATALSLAATAGFAESTLESSDETDMTVSAQSGYVMDPSAHENNGMFMHSKDSIAMPTSTFRTLANARGEPLKTTQGDVVGMIQEIDYNERGNPEIVVDVDQKHGIQADELVVTVTPGNVRMMGDALLLDTTLADLKLEAKKNAKDVGDRVSVTLF